MSEPILEVKNLTKAFGSVQVLKNVSFSVKIASLTIIAGPDGSGKSTLLQCILGLIRPDKGEVWLKGEPLGNNYHRLRQIAGYMKEQFSLYPDLTVEENLDFYAAIQMVRSEVRQPRKQQLLERTGLAPFRRRHASALSGGMKQKLALAAALISSPELLLLDEPTTGIDPASRLEFFDLIQEWKKDGRTIILTTPYLDEAEKADEVIFFQEGRIIKQGLISELKKQFPARVFNLQPEGNIFEAYEQLVSLFGAGNVFLRGRWIRVLHPEGEKRPLPFASRIIQEEEPRLEDIYFYYERLSHE